MKSISSIYIYISMHCIQFQIRNAKLTGHDQFFSKHSTKVVMNTWMAKLIIPFWVSLFCIVKSQTTIDCTESYDCLNDSLIFPDTDTDIDCDGYKSCLNNPLIHISNEGRIYCQGGWSCDNVDKMIDCCDGTVRCIASNSCTDVSNISANGVDIDCRGANACMGSIITGVNELQCSGEWSCSNMIIDYNDDVPRLLFYGAFSGAGAIINSNGETQTNNIIITFNGHFSGYNATLHCWSGHSCFVTCHGNACFNLTVICHDSSACDVDLLDCDESIGIVCPNIITYVNDNMTIYNYSSYISSIITVNDVLNSLPSLAIEETIEHEIICETAPVNSGYNTRCLDWRECEDETIELVEGNISDHICCGGMYACDNTSITIKSDFNLIVAGYYAFFDGDVTFGNDSNSNSDSRSNSSIYCDGDVGCGSSTIRNAKLAHCSAEEGCENAKLYNVDQVLCTGYLSCGRTYIYNPSAVYIAGYESLSNAIIDTKIFDDSDGMISHNLSVYFYGRRNVSVSRSETVEIYCNKGNICNINCYVWAACQYVDIYCHSSAYCNITCDFEDDNYCPAVFDIATSNPTKIPSKIPTNTPNIAILTSVFPTQIPSEAPTISTSPNDKFIKQLSQIYNYIFGSLLILFFGLFILGFIDGKFYRKNELFNPAGIWLCGAYLLDFVSGMFSSVCLLASFFYRWEKLCP